MRRLLKSHKGFVSSVAIFLAVLLICPANVVAFDQPHDSGHNVTSLWSELQSALEWLRCFFVCPGQGSPVQIQHGNYFCSHQDLFISGLGLSLEVTRKYDSHDLYDGPFGHGWKFNYDIKLTETTDETCERVTIRRADGVRLEFSRNPDSTYIPPQGRQDHLAKNADGTFTWYQSGCTTCGGPTYRFDTSGYLIQIHDAYGNQMAFDYDATGKLIQVTDAPGRKLNITYGANKKILSITDPADRTFRYGYDSSGNLTTYTDPLGNTTRYSYDTDHNLISITDARGNTVTTITYDVNHRAKTYSEYGETWTYTYDPQNNTTCKDDSDGNRWTFSYNDTGQLVYVKGQLDNETHYTWDDNLNWTSTKNARGYTTNYTYDINGNRLTETDPLGNTVTYTYDPTHNKVATITDPLGHVTKYEYDSKGNLIKVIRDYGGSLQNETLYVYDSFGNMTSITDPMGNTTSFAYDTYGNLTGVANALGYTTAFTYDILGKLLTQTDSRGNSITLTYNLLNRITFVKDALNNTTTTSTYDTNGNISDITNAAGNTTTMVYNTHNQVTRITDALGNVTQYTYDARGNRTGETDANGNTTSYAYDVLDRLTAITNALGNDERYSYDGDGNVLSVIDANTTTSSYDSLNRVIKTTYPDGTFVSLFYDAAGNPISTTDRIGNTINYIYDSLNRLVRRTFPDATTENYTYDLNGNILTANNSDISYSFSYDTLNRMIQATNSTLGKTVSCSYLCCGLKSSMTDSQGGITNYTYDALSRLISLKNPQGETTNYSYDTLSRIIKKNLANGTYTDYSYDAVSRLVSLTNKNSGNSVISDYNYTYDNIRNRTSMTTSSGMHGYSYDSIYQLLLASHPSLATETYTYDPVHNRLTSADYSNWAYDNNNRLTNYNGTNFTFDANGNTLSKTDTLGTTNYQYDFNNRLIRIDYHDGTFSEYGYDPFGNRVKNNVNGSVIWFIYDLTEQLPDVIAEYDSNGTLSTSYTHSPRTDEVISMRRSGASYYYQTDGLGSITFLIDSTETVINAYEYDSFGNIVNKTGALVNPYEYTGRRFDNESGLMYYRARYYDPVIGRFITADPIGFAGGVNFYSYVINNPINRIDPSGLYSLEEFSKDWIQYYGRGFTVNLGPNLEGYLPNIAALGGKAKLTGMIDDKGHFGIKICIGPGFGVGAVIKAAEISPGRLTPHDWDFTFNAGADGSVNPIPSIPLGVKFGGSIKIPPDRKQNIIMHIYKNCPPKIVLEGFIGGGVALGVNANFCWEKVYQDFSSCLKECTKW